MRRIAYDVMRTIDSATFTGSYQKLGSALTFACSIIKVVNLSAVNVTVSIDGTNDHDIAPATSFFLYDETANHTVEYVFVPKGTQFWVKGSASTGLVYLVTQYIKSEGE